VHNKIVSGRGGGDPPPPFFRVGVFPLPKRKDGSPRRHSAFFGGGSPPPEEGLGK